MNIGFVRKITLISWNNKIIGCKKNKNAGAGA